MSRAIATASGEGDVNGERCEDFSTTVHFMSFNVASFDIPLVANCIPTDTVKAFQPSGNRTAIFMKSAYVYFVRKQKQDIESKQLSKIEWCNGKLVIWEWLLYLPLQRSIYSFCELVILPSLENLF